MAWYDALNSGSYQQLRPGSVQELRAFNAAQQAQLAQQAQQAQQVQAPQKEKGFWTDQISTGGGIAGALGGAAAGSFAGPIGTLIGGIIGGAVGSGGGQVAENAVAGEKDLMKDVGKEALLGGVLSAPPIRASKAAFGVSRALLSGAGSTAAKTAAEKALTSPGMISRALGGATSNLGAKTYAQAFNLPRRFAGKLQPEQTSKALMSYGISGSIDNIGAKSNDVLSKLGGMLDKSVSNIGGDVKVGDVTSVMKGLSKYNISKGELSALRNSITDIGTKGRAIGFENPSSMLDKIRELEKRGYDLVKAGESNLAKNPNQAALGSAYIDAAKELEDNLYTGIMQKGTLKALQTKENIKMLNDTAKGLGDKFAAVTDPKELRSLMSPFVKARQLVNLTRDEMQAAGTQAVSGISSRLGSGGIGAGLGSVVGGPAGAVLGGATGMVTAPLMRGTQEALQAPISTGAGRIISGLTGNAASRVAGGLSNAGKQTIQQTAGRALLGGSEPQDMSAQSSAAMSAMPSTMMMNNINMPQSYQSQQQMSTEPSIGGVTKSQLEQAMVMAAMDGNSSAYGDLKNIYDMLPQSTSAYGDLSQSNQSALASAANATNTLDQLEQLYSAAGGAQGRIGGFVKGLTSSAGFDSNAKAYGDLAQASVTQIAKALAGSGAGTVSDADARVIIAALPTLSDTPEEAQIKFNALRQRLQAAQQNTLLYGSGQSAQEVQPYGYQ